MRLVDEFFYKRFVPCSADKLFVDHKCCVDNRENNSNNGILKKGVFYDKRNKAYNPCKYP
jgi:hypothetical protein